MKETSHKIKWDNIKVLTKESNSIKRKFKEAIKIKSISQENIMNKKDECKVLLYIWDSILT